MPSVSKFFPLGTYPPSTMNLLREEARGAAATLGAVCSNVRYEYGDPTEELIFDFDVAPNDPALIALLDAYPSTATAVSGSFALTVSTDFPVSEQLIAAGTQVLLEVEVFAVLGTADAAQPEYVSERAVAYRNTTGDVKIVTSPSGRAGNIPGFTVSYVGTTESVQISISARKAGTLTIHKSEVTRLGEYTL